MRNNKRLLVKNAAGLLEYQGEAWRYPAAKSDLANPASQSARTVCLPGRSIAPGWTRASVFHASVVKDKTLPSDMRKHTKLFHIAAESSLSAEVKR